MAVIKHCVLGSETAAFFALCAAALLLGPSANGAVLSRTQSQNGTWQDNATWGGQSYPDNATRDTHDVIIPDNREITGFTTDITIRNLTLEGMWTISGATSGRVLNVEGNYTALSGTTLAIDAPLLIHFKGTSTFVGNLEITDPGAGIRNSGTFNYNSSPLPTGPFDPMGTVLGETANFLNDVGGTFNAGGAGNVDLDNITLVNRGRVDIFGNSFKFGTFTQKTGGSAVTVVRSGARFEGTTINFNRGQVRGGGTIQGTTIGFGSEAPALIGAGLNDGDRDTLTFDGGVTFTGGNTLFFDIAGASDFDKLVFNSGFSLNNLTLAGTTIGMFTPSPMESFEIMTGTGFTGIFANAFDVSGNSGRVTFDTGTFDVTVNTGSVVLSGFEAVPEPSTWALIGLSGAAMLAIRRFRR